MRPFIRLLAVLCLVHAAAAEELPALCARVLAEAEGLGLAGTAGLEIRQGVLTPPDLAAWKREGLVSERHLHARRPDGTWLVDLVRPVPEGQLDAGEIAALTPFVAGSAFVRPAEARMAPFPDALAQARRIVAGAPEAATGFPPRPYDGWSLAFYPRQARADDPEEALRLACAAQLEAQGRREAALAIAPARWRAALRLRFAGPPAAGAPLDGAAAAAAAYPGPGHWREPGVDEPLLPDLADDALVALVARPEAGAAGWSLGEVALFALSYRWGFDPALLAGRDPQAPWDETEQQAVAAGLGAWWARTAGLPLSGRWLEALAGQPVDRALTGLQRRAAGMQSRRFTIRDRLAHHTWKGPVAPVLPPDDDQELADAYITALLSGWQGLAAPPAGLDLKAMRQLLPLAVAGRSFSMDTDPSAMQAAMARAAAIRQSFAAAVAPWPRAGELAEALILWDDIQGAPAGLDAQVEAALAVPGLTVAQARHALRWWVHRCSPARWARIDAILQRDPGDAQWQALAAMARNPYLVDIPPVAIVNAVDLLIWRQLRDARPSPDGGTVGTALAQVIGARIREAGHPRLDAAAQEAVAADPASEASRAGLERAYAAEATRLLHGFAGAPPPVAAEPAPVATAAQPPPPGLTGAEAADVRAALAEACVLGFPDLAGAQVLLEDFPRPGTTWWGAHLRLADGSWLAEGTIPVPTADPGPQPAWALPVPDFGLQVAGQLPPAAQERLRGGQGRGLGPVQSRAGDPVLPALAWWLSGADADGRCLVAAVYAQATTLHDLAEPWSIADGRGGDERGALAAVPEVADGVRRALARWFRHRLVWAGDAATADHALDAIRRLLPPADRAAWEPLLAQLRARIDLPATAPAGADLAARLQSWRDTDRTAAGAWRKSARVPAARSDTAALVALLGDDRPTRWVTRHALPRPLGDAALQALGELWGFDWRWLVAADPAVAAALPPRARDRVRDGDDQWLWAQSAWTAPRRRVTVAALQAWWAAHAADPPAAAAFAAMPVQLWGDAVRRLQPADLADAAVGAALAARLRAMPPPQPGRPMQQYVVHGVLAVALARPGDAAIGTALAAWPRRAWLDGVAALRAEMAGDPATLDRWIGEALAQGRPPADSEPGDVAIDPWHALGMWVHRPSPSRLAALRAVLARGPDDAAMRWLLVDAGGRDWQRLWLPLPGNRSPAAAGGQAIPRQLALDALDDRRPLPVAARELLRTLSAGRAGDVYELAAAVPDGARVCDWAAARMLLRGSVLGPEPGDLGSAADLLAAPLAVRDARVAELRRRLAPLAAEAVEEAGLAAPSTAPAEPSRF